MNNTPFTDAVVQLTTKYGKCIAILGRVKRAIMRSNHPELAEAFIKEATAGDYDHLLCTCMLYVTVN